MLSADGFFQSFWSDKLAVSLLSYGMIAYAIIKDTGYSYWCSSGLKLSFPLMPRRQRVQRAGLYGIIRLLIGIVLGFVLGPVFFILWRLGLIGYLVVYVPARWFEWGIMQLILSKASRSADGFVFGYSSEWKRWRRQGIVLSCILDLSIPIGAVFGLMATPGHGGRIFC